MLGQSVSHALSFIIKRDIFGSQAHWLGHCISNRVEEGKVSSDVCFLIGVCWDSWTFLTCGSCSDMKHHSKTCTDGRTAAVYLLSKLLNSQQRSCTRSNTELENTACQCNTSHWHESFQIWDFGLPNFGTKKFMVSWHMIRVGNYDDNLWIPTISTYIYIHIIYHTGISIIITMTVIPVGPLVPVLQKGQFQGSSGRCMSPWLERSLGRHHLSRWRLGTQW